MNPRPNVLSLTQDSKAGFCMAKDMSSSTREMFLPPRAALCAECGRFRKSNTLVLSCAVQWHCQDAMAARSRILCLFLILYVF